MTREQIERAAGEYSGSVLGFKDNPVVMNNHKAFTAGAEWRIDSVCTMQAKSRNRKMNLFWWNTKIGELKVRIILYAMTFGIIVSD